MYEKKVYDDFRDRYVADLKKQAMFKERKEKSLQELR